jgi:hypothetical protein
MRRWRRSGLGSLKRCEQELPIALVVLFALCQSKGRKQIDAIIVVSKSPVTIQPWREYSSRQREVYFSSRVGVLNTSKIKRKMLFIRSLLSGSNNSKT